MISSCLFRLQALSTTQSSTPTFQLITICSQGLTQPCILPPAGRQHDRRGKRQRPPLHAPPLVLLFFGIRIRYDRSHIVNTPRHEADAAICLLPIVPRIHPGIQPELITLLKPPLQRQPRGAAPAELRHGKQVGNSSMWLALRGCPPGPVEAA